MKDFVAPPEAPLRPPAEVMRLARMGQMFPTRLSFLRILTRLLQAHGTPPRQTLWDMNDEGYGDAVLTLTLHGRPYSLVALSRPLADEDRSDRVIATAWDAAFVLYDGVPDAAEVARIAAAAPLQEAGRFTQRDLVLSRANKSVRLWTHVVAALKGGNQPDAAFINKVGYLMRTTAVYGNGKFGIADRDLIADRPGLQTSFMVEMLTVWLIRHFTHALVEHVGGNEIAPGLKRHLGIGNSTGLGMAPFLVSHPVLLNNWMMVRETALARVRAVARIDDDTRSRLVGLYRRACGHLAEWHVPDPEHQADIDTLRADWAGFEDQLLVALSSVDPMETLWQAGQQHNEAFQELLLSLMLEPFGTLIDGLAECLTDPVGGTGAPFETTGELRRALEDNFGWALGRNYSNPADCCHFWYVSEEKLEPRFGNRHEDDGAERESPLDIARKVAALHADLPEDDAPVAGFLAQFPQHLMAVERVQINACCPYSEIRDNLIGETCRPIDMLRAKLGMFGATKFDPKSTLWTRITMAQGAPLASDLDQPMAQDWWSPVINA